VAVPQGDTQLSYTYHFLDLTGAKEYTCTGDPTGCQLIWVSSASIPSSPRFCRMPFLPQPSQFALAWTGTGICCPLPRGKPSHLTGKYDKKEMR